MASLQHDFDYDNLPQPAINPSPTSGQILALGYLMILKRVYIAHDISEADLQELVTMRLCHYHRPGFIMYAYDISSRLLREWMPYHRLVVNWHKCRNAFETHPVSPSPTFVVDTQALMDRLVLECGRGLAANWRRWKMEDAQR